MSSYDVLLEINGMVKIYKQKVENNEEFYFVVKIELFDRPHLTNTCVCD